MCIAELVNSVPKHDLEAVKSILNAEKCQAADHTRNDQIRSHPVIFITSWYGGNPKKYFQRRFFYRRAKMKDMMLLPVQ